MPRTQFLCQWLPEARYIGFLPKHFIAFIIGVEPGRLLVVNPAGKVKILLCNFRMFARLLGVGNRDATAFRCCRQCNNG